MADAPGTDALTIAIIGATITGLGSVVVAGINGFFNRRTEVEKDESARILEMIKTGDINVARKNLQFLIDSGLIADKARVRSIKAYLAANPAGAPVLPAAGDRFKIEPTEALTPALSDKLNSALREYSAYLDTLGLDSKSKIAKVRIERNVITDKNALSYYEPSTEEIVVDQSIASDIDLPRRDLTIHVLNLQRNNEITSLDSDEFLLESDLADYFVCSFSGRPQFGQDLAKTLNYPTPFYRSLESRRPFHDAKPAIAAFNENREVWGGAFWEIRAALGQNAADKILATAWKNMPPLGPKAHVAPVFIKTLLDAAEDSVSPEASKEVSKILRHRKFPLPN